MSGAILGGGVANAGLRDTTFSTGTAYSWGAWLNRTFATGGPSAGYSFVAQPASVSNTESGYGLYLVADSSSAGHIEIFDNLGNTQIIVTPASGLTSGVWYYVGLSVSGTSCVVYWASSGQHNTQSSQSATGLSVSVVEFDIGYSGGGDFWSHSIAGLRVWTAQLSAADHAAEAQSLWYKRTNNLARFWLLSATSDLTDKINAKTFTTQGSPALTTVSGPNISTFPNLSLETVDSAPRGLRIFDMAPQTLGAILTPPALGAPIFSLGDLTRGLQKPSGPPDQVQWSPPSLRALQVRGGLYLMGTGQAPGTSGVGIPLSNIGPDGAIEQFDNGTGWQRTSNQPITRGDNSIGHLFGNCAREPYSGDIFLIENQDLTAQQNAHRYRPGNDGWITIADLPNQSGGATTMGRGFRIGALGKFWNFAGRTGDGAFTPVNTIFSYDSSQIAPGSWVTYTATITTPGHDIQGCYDGKHTVFFGGGADNDNDPPATMTASATFYKYDLSNPNTAPVALHVMPEGVSGACFIYIPNFFGPGDDGILRIGGAITGTTNGTGTNLVRLYRVNTDTWSNLNNYPFNVWRATGVMQNGIPVVAGGLIDPLSNQDHVSAVQVYNGVNSGPDSFSPYVHPNLTDKIAGAALMNVPILGVLTQNTDLLPTPTLHRPPEDRSLFAFPAISGGSGLSWLPAVQSDAFHPQARPSEAIPSPAFVRFPTPSLVWLPNEIDGVGHREPLRGAEPSPVTLPVQFLAVRPWLPVFQSEEFRPEARPSGAQAPGAFIRFPTPALNWLPTYPDGGGPRLGLRAPNDGQSLTLPAFQAPSLYWLPVQPPDFYRPGVKAPDPQSPGALVRFPTPSLAWLPSLPTDAYREPLKAPDPIFPLAPRLPPPALFPWLPTSALDLGRPNIRPPDPQSAPALVRFPTPALAWLPITAVDLVRPELRIPPEVMAFVGARLPTLLNWLPTASIDTGRPNISPGAGAPLVFKSLFPALLGLVQVWNTDAPPRFVGRDVVPGQNFQALPVKPLGVFVQLASENIAPPHRMPDPITPFLPELLPVITHPGIGIHGFSRLLAVNGISRLE